uniref:Uncharacterized protein n=1 Tax=Dicentrarchus labrax TaxID=13489 RepID=E6ZG25_DICLA|nr:Uncharacterized protein [Dicentrarchus labrax]CBN81600.1 Uncharacterized protein [Dicentrarchus labrax]
MEQKSVADITDKSSQVSSIQAPVHHLHPSYTAQTGGNVIAPTLVGCNAGVININISTDRGSKDALNHDTADGCGILQPQMVLGPLPKRGMPTHHKGGAGEIYQRANCG